ncbi:MAG TPA: hypothetical protein VGR62_20965 [Candidatus Binatia bacterium]|jgi:hypothetical protein|nr:hypothetical protein [Candidatus Binatia bacterium]
MTSVSIAVFVLGAVLVLAVAVFVASPLFRPSAPLPPEALPGTNERWERQKRQAFAAIKEVELDHQMGKISDEDLGTMRGKFEGEALEAMAALEREEKR